MCSMKDSLVNVKNPQGTAILIANFDFSRGEY